MTLFCIVLDNLEDADVDVIGEDAPRFDLASYYVFSLE